MDNLEIDSPGMLIVSRLNFNHWLIKEPCGYLLHPKVKRPEAGAWIADVATGTGTWLLETAVSLPDNVQLHGFDISVEQFPPKQWTPKNVSFSEHDFCKPFPEEHLGQYDIVHAQLLICMINDPDAELVLRHFTSLLKPGGQLQWVEPDMEQLRVISFNPEASTTHCDTLFSMLSKPRASSSYNWLGQMRQLFEKCGLEMEVLELIPLQDHLRLAWGQSTLAGIDDVIPKMMADGNLSGGKLADLIPGLISEFQQGVTVDHPWQIFVGSKPKHQ